MDWSKERILQTIELLSSDSKNMTESNIKEKYSEFIEKFPKLYYSSLDPNFDLRSLKTMLNYRQKAEDENIHVLVRDITIGEELSKKYLYPVVGEPTNEQKAKAMKKVVQKYYSEGGK